jgi:hypothetical protein
MIIKVTLSLEKDLPEVSRTIRIPAFKQMRQLHRAIQSSFGLWDYHLYQFDVTEGVIPYRVYSFTESWQDDKLKQKQQLSDWDNLHPFAKTDDLRNKELKMHQIRIVDFFLGTQRVKYQYDFGEGWEFDIRVIDGDFDEGESDNFIVLETEGPDITEDARFEFYDALNELALNPAALVEGSVDLSWRRVVDQNVNLMLLKLNDGDF